MGEGINLEAFHLLAKEIINRTLKEYTQGGVGEKATIRMEVICASYPYSLWSKLLNRKIRDLQEDILERVNRLDGGEPLDGVLIK